MCEALLQSLFLEQASLHFTVVMTVYVGGSPGVVGFTVTPGGGVGVGAGVLVTSGVGVGVGDGPSVGVGVGVGLGPSVGVGVRVGVRVGSSSQVTEVMFSAKRQYFVPPVLVFGKQ